MKIIILLAICVCVKPVFAQQDKSPNVFIITTDGFRSQEIFNGADSIILSNPLYVKDTALLKQLFWDSNVDERRRMLMPFIWKTLAKQGSIYGNRDFDNKVLVSNPYRFSYAGYNEIFTGYADPAVIANRKKWNRNDNVLQFLNEQEMYKNKVAAFASWNLFDYIFNKPGSDFYLNSGYRNIEHDSLTATEILANGIQEQSVNNAAPTRNDMLTFVTAKEYIQTKHPKVVYISFGETDEYAHSGKYDEYLQSAHMFDEYLAQLWYLVNKDPFYRNNTSFIITTDHGRGQKSNTWVRHDMFTAGSKNTWLMTLGRQFENKGEVKTDDAIYSEQIAQTIAHLLGYDFIANHPVADAISLNASIKNP
ncbi:alkaline phosphatase family protein [Ferruginibacter sp. SUN106]|uniref:alkaline phosphatase family protein n=1 Tax=Ferruginibacter sp. SUN106 TaxID=2978348 RepID=UPI003D35E3D1